MSLKTGHCFASADYEQSNLRILNLMVGILEETSAFLDEECLSKQQIMSTFHKLTELKRRAKSYGALQEGVAVIPGMEKINNLFTRLDIQMLSHQALLAQS
ncbi:MAG: hypothetical protein HOM11_00480 [Methylococcales bacterium]|jgi:hypothetical protein|nr:hypothetical protein [Methylococcales bacterium]MBT7443048.1 hypothetical protein [Methylococcales bacterium]